MIGPDFQSAGGHFYKLLKQISQSYFTNTVQNFNILAENKGRAHSENERTVQVSDDKI